MPKFNEFLKDLIKKTGVDMADPEVAATIGASALKEIEISEDLVQKFYNGIYTKESALNDPEIKRKYLGSAKGEIYDGTDRRINQIFREAGFSEEFIADLNKRSLHDNGEYVDTTKKLAVFGEELKKLLASNKKEDPKSKANDEAVIKMQEDLNNQIKELKEQHENQLKDIQEKAKLNKITGELRSKILSFPLLDMSDDDKLDLANAKINKLISGYSILENEKGGLDIRTKDDPRMEVYDAQRNKLTIDTLLNTELKSFVKKSDNQGQVNSPSTPSPFPIQSKPMAAMTLAEQGKARIERTIAEQKNKLQNAS